MAVILLDGSLSQWVKTESVPAGGALASLAAAVAGFFVGELLDASRDLLEWVWDRFQPVRWEFLVTEGEKVEKFMTSYFTWYVFDCNASLALAIVLLLASFTPTPAPPFVRPVLALSLVIFVVNARQLRKEMAPLTGESRQAPDKAT
jgi:hypothetical protein